MAFKSFSDYLTLEKKYSPHTIKAYMRDLETFKDFLKDTYDEDQIDHINYAQIRSWIIQLVDNGISNRTVNRKVSSLNTYYKFLLKTHSITVNPLAKHKALKTKTKVQVPFSQDEVNAVIKHLNEDHSFEGLRNKLIIELFYSTGIRRKELVEIKVSDIDLSQKKP